MFSGFHKITIEPMDTLHAKVLIDGQNSRCRAYTIRQSVDEVPTVELELLGVGRFSGEAGLEFSNLEIMDLCMHMTQENLEQMVELWSDHHGVNFGLVDLTDEKVLCVDNGK